MAHLDKHLKKVGHLEAASSAVARPIAAPGLAGTFLVIILVFAIATTPFGPLALYVVAAAVISGYMALYVGANDVANNVGPAVGGRALTLGAALAIAAVFEAAGALIAGGDVVATISKDIIRPPVEMGALDFILLMMAGFLAAAMWIHLATYLGAPVSTTHSVVGGVVGAGVASAGFGAVNWSTMGTIAASWVISPVLGGLIAAAFLWFIKARVIYRDDKIAAARVWVPVLVGIMAGAFAAYLSLKGLKHLVKISLQTALLIGLAGGVATWAAMIPVIRRQSAGLENRNKSLKVLFGIPLVVSAALLSFAHGANDVANAVGPLAAIVQASGTGAIGGEVSIPHWVMVIGAFGISFGLFLFGPKLIRMVGSQITKLNPMRAYCVALSAALTVIVASWLGLPVSSTHIAVGAVFGVGFFREWDTERRLKKNRVAVPDQPVLAPE